MRKLTCTILIITIMVGGLALVGNGHFGVVQASSVSGIINSDTTWTNAGNPYTLFGPILVSNNVTLTIEPGVIIHLNDKYIQVNGTLVARGTSTDQIYIDGGSIIFTASSNRWDEHAGSGCIIENAVVDVDIRDASPKINSSTLRGTIRGGSPLIINNNVNRLLSVFDGSPVIFNNFFNKSQINIYGGSPVIMNNKIIGIPTVINGGDFVRNLPEYGINLEGNNISAYIAHNTITRHFTAGINAQAGTITIERNLITNNGDGIAIGPTAILIIQNNTIADNEHIGIRNAAPSSPPAIIYNNIQNNSYYNIHLGAGSTDTGNPNNITATYNWWGTTVPYLISQTIYDFKNDFNLGTVNFTPYLNASNPQATPNPNAPLPTPTPSPIQTPTPTPSQPTNPAPTSTQTSTPTPLQSQTPTASPTQISIQDTLQSGFYQVVVVVFAAVVVVLAVAVVVLLRRKPKL